MSIRDALILWIRIALVYGAISTTAIPIIFSVVPWRTRPIGRLFMIQAIAFASALDIQAVRVFWKPKDMIPVYFVNALTLSCIGVATTALAIYVWRMVRARKKPL